MPNAKLRRFRLPRAVLLALIGLAVPGACGSDDGDPSDAAPEQRADALPTGPADAAAGVVCDGAQANYSGMLNEPAASDDGTTLEFRGGLGASDVLRIAAASGATADSSVDLPDSTWSVTICVNDDDESCTDALSAYSGTLAVTSTEGRFQASIDRVIFVDDLGTPTCSASVSQSSIDVAIRGPL